MLPKRIPRPPPGVFAEIVRGELGRLPQEGAELWDRRFSGFFFLFGRIKEEILIDVYVLQ